MGADGGLAGDLDFLDAGGLDALDPAGGDIGFQRLAALQRDGIEAQRLRAIGADADDHVLGGLQAEAVRRAEADTQRTVEIAPAPDHAVAWIVAIGQALDRSEPAIGVALADAGRADLAGCRGDGGDALGRLRMAGEDVEPLVVGALVLAAAAEGGVAAERGEEAAGAIGIVAGAGNVADADLVGGQFLLARELGERELRAGADSRATRGVLQDLRDDLIHQRRFRFLLGALDGVLRSDMGDLMRQHGGDLGGVVG